MRLSLAIAAALAAPALAGKPRRAGETVMVPMRDGTKLATYITQPLLPKSGKLPAVFERSPYGVDAFEEDIPVVMAELLGYVAVSQDFRGTEASEGNFTLWHDSADDAYDTIEWITQQSWSNGEVFTTGVSADGIDEYAQVRTPHPALKAQTVIFATITAYETFYPGGAYRQGLIEGWLHMTVPTQYAVSDALVRAQEQPGTPWWQPVNGSLFYNNVAWPSLHWHGFFDIFSQGGIDAFRGYNAAPGMAGKARLVIDPLGHCQDGADFFPRNTILGRVLLPAFMALDLMAHSSVIVNKTWPSDEGVKNVTFYVMGANEAGSPGLYWTTLDDFPQATPTNYYLAPSGGLATAPPTTTGALSTYLYDPRNPVGTIGGNNYILKCGPLDQRPLESRQDVLVFTTPPLTAQVAVMGEVTATLYVSTNVTDTDFVVKLIDVYPASSSNPTLAGSSTLLADGIARMRWRAFPSTNLPQPLSGNPSDVYEVTLTLWSTAYIFAPGHSIRVHVTSSNAPRFWPNDNLGVPMSKVDNSGNVTAQSSVHYDSQYPSHVTLPVVDAATQLPPFPVTEAVRSMATRHAKRLDPTLEGAPAAAVDAAAEALMEQVAARMDAVTLGRGGARPFRR